MVLCGLSSLLSRGTESGKPSKTLGSQVRVEISQALAAPLVGCVTVVRKEPLWPSAPLLYSECTGAASQTGTADVESGCSGLISFLSWDRNNGALDLAVWTCVIVSVILMAKTHQDSLRP